MNERIPAREAIVFSWGTWSGYNVPERIAIGLGRAGWQVLYCGNPASFLHRPSKERKRMAPGVEVFRPASLGHRLNGLPFLRSFQTVLLVRQVLRQAAAMGMKNPMVIYTHGHWLEAMARELKTKALFLVFVCLDYLDQEDPLALAAPADLTLVIPETVYHMLRAKFGGKIRLIPQLGPDFCPDGAVPRESQALACLERVPRPRLVYLGPPANRLHAGLLKELLLAHPEWHFVACGQVPGLSLPNIHDIGRFRPEELPAIARSIDVGLMPYDCGQAMNLHCVPFKLFDYFAAGLPVISTPLIHLWRYGDLVYLGDSSEELAEGIRKALAEPADDPRREKRREIARAHSLERVSKLLSEQLLEGVQTKKGREAQP